MRTLRYIDPQTGYMKEFKLEDDKPCIIGKLPLEKVFQNLRVILRKIPDTHKRLISGYIGCAKNSIDMENCKMHSKYISRAHYMIFPGDSVQIIDLFSQNGTKIATLGGGISLVPGRKTNLKNDNIIIIANGQAFFHYRSLEMNFEPKSFINNVEKNEPANNIHENQIVPQIFESQESHYCEYDSM